MSWETTCLIHECDAPGDPQMIHRPPYVPKLHSSQILTSVFGLTYESHTGLFIAEKNAQVQFLSKARAQTDHSPFPVAFLAQTADGCVKERVVSRQVGVSTLKERTYAWLTSAHDEIWVMLRHGEQWLGRSSSFEVKERSTRSASSRCFVRTRMTKK